MHELYDDRLSQLTDSLSGANRVSRQVLGEVMARLLVAAPEPVSREDLRVYLKLSPATMNKAVTVLERAGLISRKRQPAAGPGRPVEPLVLGSDDWAVIGVRISQEADRSYVTGAVVGLNGEPVAPFQGRQAPITRSGKEAPPVEQVADEVAYFIAGLVTDWQLQAPSAGRRLLGIGVEVSGHVHEGSVIRADHTGWQWRDSDFANLLSERVGVLLDEAFPVLLENDVNLLAIHRSYRHNLRNNDAAVVAVYDEGVGAGLLLDGFLYRGSHGLAGELGHIPIAAPLAPPPAPETGAAPRRSPADPVGFSDPCQCSTIGAPLYGHVDCYATPARILGELKKQGKLKKHEGFNDVATRPAHGIDGALTIEGEVFYMAGRALGLGLVSLIHTVNPALLIHLPPALANAKEGDDSAACIYRQSMEDTVKQHAFSTGYDDALPLTPENVPETQLHVEALDMDMVPLQAARDAAIAVIDSFIAHARQADSCTSRTVRSDLTRTYQGRTSDSEDSNAKSIHLPTPGTPTRQALHLAAREWPPIPGAPATPLQRHLAAQKDALERGLKPGAPATQAQLHLAAQIDALERGLKPDTPTTQAEHLAALAAWKEALVETLTPGTPTTQARVTSGWPEIP
jgi:ROK family